MDYEPELTGWKNKISNVSFEEFQTGPGFQVRQLPQELVRPAGQDDGPGIQPEPLIRMREALDEPGAEEAGAAGDKKRLAADFFPQRLCLTEDCI
jgi:hypothetical protein